MKRFGTYFHAIHNNGRPLRSNVFKQHRLMSKKTQTAYDVLNVKSHAPQDQIKQAYKQLAIEWHPDRHAQKADQKNAVTRFQEISEAYQLLSDPEQRKQYDSDLAAASDEVERAKAANRFRAQSWNTPIINVQERMRNAKREEPSTSRGMMAGALVLITGNFVFFLHMLAG